MEDITQKEAPKKTKFAKIHQFNPAVAKRFYMIPSLITMTGVFCGFTSIIYSFKGNFKSAVIAIIIAGILDGLDGRVARKLNATSEFGKELDSLSDEVAFGVAPAVMVYSWAFSSNLDEIGVLALFLYVVCAAARLARFNIVSGGEPKSYFQGLPTPGAAAALISMVFIHLDKIQNFYLSSAILIYVVFIAYLMVSNISFFSIKNIKFDRSNLNLKLILSGLTVAFFWYDTPKAMFALSVIYIFSGPLYMGYSKLKKVKVPYTE